jgi:hypothetical protein
MERGSPRYMHGKGAIAIPAREARSWMLIPWQLIGESELFARLVISPVARPKADRIAPSPSMS